MESLNKKVMLTCYDASFARICTDTEAFDYLLVGDSLGMVLYGAPNTWEVRLEDICRHTQAVARGIKRSKADKKPVLVSDLPAGTYETPEQALESAQKLKEAGADIVKLEGAFGNIVSHLKERGFRVCGHLGFTPQTIESPKVQGRTPEDAEKILEDAKELEKAGCELLVLELIPSVLARQITDAIRIPSIGIGAGPYCDGQVLVLYDVLGLDPDFSPRFLKKYLQGYQLIREAVQEYAREVREQKFPSPENSF